jgi:hypothetical protein
LPAAPVVRPEKHANATKAATPQRRPLEARSHYEFTLGPTSRWARVGPVQMSVAKLDRERNRFDLSVKHGDFRYDRKQVKLREAVWIDLGGGLPPVRVQADRIGRYEVHGSVMTAVRAGNGLTTSRQQHGD